ncbi:MAG: hypothetical protein K9N35_09110 [Candidatus Marinimicrobia bacterium]|nr:hypothetical protein [Candidatus Neomarinimicrobiota bacterium]
MASSAEQYAIYSRVINDLKEGTISQVYFATGSDYYLYRHFLHHLRSAYTLKYGDSADLQQRWGTDLKSVSDLSSLLGGGGLFSSASLALVHEIQDAGISVKTNLAEIVGSPPPGTVILIHYSISEYRSAKWLTAMQSIGRLVPLNPPDASILPRIVKDLATKHTLKLKEEAIFRLIEQSSGELAVIDNELEKLSIYLENNMKEVDRTLVDEVSGALENAQVSEFIDAVTVRDRKLAIQTLFEIDRRGKEGLPFLVSLLYRRLMQLMALHENYEARKSIGKGITAYYFLKELEPYSRNYNLAELQAATVSLADLDHQFRLGTMDMLSSFSSWISKSV